MKFNSWLTHLLLVLVLVSGCTLQKRSYRDGYYLHWRTKAPKAEKSSDSPNDSQTQSGKNESEVKTELVPTISAPSEEILVSKENLPFSYKKENITESTYFECNDSIWFTNGSVIRAYVVGKTKTEIKYKKCDDPETIFVVPKNDVIKIKYPNGSYESLRDQRRADRTRKGASGVAYTSFVWAMLALIAIILAIVFGFLALNGDLAALILGILFAIIFGLVAFIAAILAVVFSTTALIMMRNETEKNNSRIFAYIALAVGALITLTGLVLLITSKL